MSIALQGIYAPVVTPFLGNGTLDRAGFERNLRAHVGAGLAGAVVTGSTGEAALLDESERDALLEWARPLLGQRHLIAGIGGESTRGTIDRAKRAADRGADAALVVAPHYFGGAMTSDALRAHYTALADASPIPIVLYNIPKYMHFRLEPALVRELAQHRNVVGIKDSSGDRALMDEYLALASDAFTVLTGNAQLLRHAVDHGARGGILAVSLFAPAIPLGIMDAVARRDAAAAEVEQSRLNPLGKVIVGELGIPAVKAAMDAVGLAGGAPRSPLLPLPAPERNRVRQLLHDAELAVAA